VAGRASAADFSPVLRPHRLAVDNIDTGRYQAPMLRRLYDWCIAAAHKPYAAWIIGVVSFCESSFFPVPPDVMLIPMSIARPEKAYSYALLCTWTSVAGGVAGYLIGALLYDSLGQWVIQLYGYGDKVEAFRAAYAQYGAWIILLKGLTPIPFKLVTITSGFAGYNFLLFVALATITRGARFFVLAFLLHRYGPAAREMIEKRLGLVTAVGAASIVLGFVIVYKVL
jgi:membrane protein YqaA with SNARE-associated domain